MSASRRRDLVSIAGAALTSPRLAAALTTAVVGAAIFAETLQRLIGWPGYIAVVVGLVLLTAAAMIANRAVIEWQGLLPISLLTFAGWASISIFWSQYQWASLSGIAYLLAFTVLGVGVALTRDTIQIVRAFGDVLRVAIAVSLIVEIFAGVLIDAPLPFLGVQGNLDQLGPLQGIMGSRNQLGLVGLIALVTFGTELVTRSVSRGVAIGSFVGAVLAVFLSRSPVAAAVLVVVVLAVLALYLLRRIKPERRTTWQLAILAVVVVLAIVAWMARSRIITLFAANSELSYRLSIWRELWGLIGQNPLQGWGWIGYWRPEIQPFPAFTVIGEREPTSAVNAYLDVWFQLGLVGIFIFIVLVLLTFTRSWLLAGRERSIVYTWPALVLVILITTSLAESSILVEYGWLTFVVCCVKAAQKLSWRQAFVSRPSALGSPGIQDL
jgi:O-antigen ligase